MYKAMHRSSYSLYILGLLSKHHALHTPLRHISLSKTMNNEICVECAAKIFLAMADYQIGRNMFKSEAFTGSLSFKNQIMI